MQFNILSQRVQLKLRCAQEEGQSLVQIMHSEYRWRQVRNIHIIDEPICQMCDIARALEVHHIEPWHRAPDLRYERCNLITLCRECHFRFGHYLNWKDYNPEIRKLALFARNIKEDVNVKRNIDKYYGGFTVGIGGL